MLKSLKNGYINCTKTGGASSSRYHMANVAMCVSSRSRSDLQEPAQKTGPGATGSCGLCGRYNDFVVRACVLYRAQVFAGAPVCFYLIHHRTNSA